MRLANLSASGKNQESTGHESSLITTRAPSGDTVLRNVRGWGLSKAVLDETDAPLLFPLGGISGLSHRVSSGCMRQRLSGCVCGGDRDCCRMIYKHLFALQESGVLSLHLKAWDLAISEGPGLQGCGEGGS